MLLYLLFTIFCKGYHSAYKNNNPGKKLAKGPEIQFSPVKSSYNDLQELNISVDTQIWVEQNFKLYKPTHHPGFNWLKKDKINTEQW